MAHQKFLNNFDTQFITSVKDVPTSGTPATELDYGILRVATGAAAALGTLTNGDFYVLTAYKRSGTVESNVEIMKVTDIDTSVINETRLTVLRAQEGTTAQAYVPGDYVSLRLTKAGAENFLQSGDIGVSAQAYDGDLTAIAGLAGTSGLLRKTGAETWTLDTATYLDATAIGVSVQGYDGDLSAIAALAGTSGLLKKTAANTWTLDTNTYLTGNQTITFSGDVSGSGTTAIGLTLNTVTPAKGGTGATTLTGYVYGNGTGAMTASTTIPGSAISGNISGNAANVTGTVAVGNGGTGATTLTGLVKGNGTGAFTAAIAGTDYQAPIGTISGLAKGNGANALTAAVAGTDYQAAITSTGLLKGAGAGSVSAAAAGTDYVTPTGSETLTNKTITTVALKETKVAMGANDINLNAGNYFTKTISGATTFTVSNVPATGTAASFILDLTNGGSATITCWAGVKWAGGTAPTLTAAGVDILGFYTHDGGTTWRGLVLAKDSK